MADRILWTAGRSAVIGEQKHILLKSVGVRKNKGKDKLFAVETNEENFDAAENGQHYLFRVLPIETFSTPCESRQRALTVAQVNNLIQTYNEEFLEHEESQEGPPEEQNQQLENQQHGGTLDFGRREPVQNQASSQQHEQQQQQQAAPQNQQQENQHYEQQHQQHQILNLNSNNNPSTSNHNDNRCNLNDRSSSSRADPGTIATTTTNGTHGSSKFNYGNGSSSSGSTLNLSSTTTTNSLGENMNNHILNHNGNQPSMSNDLEQERGLNFFSDEEFPLPGGGSKRVPPLDLGKLRSRIGTTLQAINESSDESWSKKLFTANDKKYPGSPPPSRGFRTPLTSFKPHKSTINVYRGEWGKSAERRRLMDNSEELFHGRKELQGLEDEENGFMKNKKKSFRAAPQNNSRPQMTTNVYEPSVFMSENDSDDCADDEQETNFGGDLATAERGFRRAENNLDLALKERTKTLNARKRAKKGFPTADQKPPVGQRVKFKESTVTKIFDQLEPGDKHHLTKYYGPEGHGRIISHGVPGDNGVVLVRFESSGQTCAFAPDWLKKIKDKKRASQAILDHENALENLAMETAAGKAGGRGKTTAAAADEQRKPITDKEIEETDSTEEETQSENSEAETGAENGERRKRNLEKGDKELAAWFEKNISPLGAGKPENSRRRTKDGALISVRWKADSYNNKTPLERFLLEEKIKQIFTARYKSLEITVDLSEGSLIADILLSAPRSRPGSSMDELLQKALEKGLFGGDHGGSSGALSKFQKPPLPKVVLTGETQKKAVLELQEYQIFLSEYRDSELIGWMQLKSGCTGPALHIYNSVQKQLESENVVKTNKLCAVLLHEFERLYRSENGITDQVENTILEEHLFEMRYEFSNNIGSSLIRFRGEFVNRLKLLMKSRKRTGSSYYSLDTRVGSHLERKMYVNAVKYNLGLPPWVSNKIDDQFTAEEKDISLQNLEQVLERIRFIGLQEQNKATAQQQRGQQQQRANGARQINNILPRGAGHPLNQQLQADQAQQNLNQKQGQTCCGGRGHLQKHHQQFLSSVPVSERGKIFPGCPTCGGSHEAFLKPGTNSYACPNDFVTGNREQLQHFTCTHGMGQQQKEKQLQQNPNRRTGGTSFRQNYGQQAGAGAGQSYGQQNQPGGLPTITEPPDVNSDPKIQAAANRGVRSIRRRVNGIRSVGKGATTTTTTTTTNNTETATPEGYFGKCYIEDSLVWALFDTGCDIGDVMPGSLYRDLRSLYPDSVYPL